MRMLFSCRDDRAAAGGIAAVPGRDDAARAFNDRDERDHVMRFEIAFDHKIDMAGRKREIAVATPAIAHEAHLLFYFEIRRALVLRNQAWRRRPQNWLCKRRPGPRLP